LKGLAIQPCPAIRKGPGAERYRGYKYPYLDSEAINNLADLCPKLEELRVQVKRSAGSVAECAVYRALGRFALLRNLILDLDCNSQPQQGVSELPTSVQEMLINAAIDEALVTAIWNLITDQQASQNLQNLRCTPFVQQVTNRLLGYAIDHINRSLLVTR
jgi:hypothetical protein